MGSGHAFYAGANLKEWDNLMAADIDLKNRMGNALAFKPLSWRLRKKPIIITVNRLAIGGGMEYIVNCNLIVVADTAYFSLPKVKRGISPIRGALP